jgi:hypothetical protein
MECRERWSVRRIPQLITCLGTGLLLAIAASSAPAAITVTGNISPVYDNTDPWAVTSLNVGTTAGPGTLAITAGIDALGRTGDGNDIAITITAVPEPSMFALAALGAATLYLIRRVGAQRKAP